MELAQAALLGTLATKHRARVPQLRGRGALRHEIVLPDGAHDACRAFGTQRELLVGLERLACLHLRERAQRADGEDFLAGDIRALARRAREQLGQLEHGRLDGFVAIAGEHICRRFLDGTPRARLCRQQIRRPLRCLIAHYSAFSSPLAPSSSSGSTSMGLDAAAAASISASSSSSICLRSRLAEILAKRSLCASTKVGSSFTWS